MCLDAAVPSFACSTLQNKLDDLEDDSQEGFQLVDFIATGLGRRTK